LPCALPGRTTVKEAERAAWQILFLLIPVLSTTFASTGRMFGPLGKEELGWLLIDEAGQALPQAAVGALWRAKRAVVVGDPRQLEPISQLPAQVQRELANSFGIAPDFIPAGRSGALRAADSHLRLAGPGSWGLSPVAAACSSLRGQRHRSLGPRLVPGERLHPCMRQACVLVLNSGSG
jgi:hypothetical protein